MELTLVQPRGQKPRQIYYVAKIDAAIKERMKMHDAGGSGAWLEN